MKHVIITVAFGLTSLCAFPQVPACISTEGLVAWYPFTGNADGGGLYIEYSHNGEVKAWRIDQQKEQVPAYLHGFMDKVNEKILLIQ